MAKKFIFRLESLLKLRSTAVDQAKNSLAIALNNRLMKDEEVRIKQDYFASILVKDHTSFFLAIDLQAQWHHRQCISAEIQQLQKEVELLTEIEEIKRLELAEAMKREKIVEKLKEHKVTENKEKSAKEEQSFLDEIGGRSTYPII